MFTLGRFSLICCLFLIIVGSAKASNIYIVNESQTVSISEIQQAVPVFQAALDQDFTPAWGQTATLVLGKGPGWKIYLRDTIDVMGAAGYHDVSPDGVPYAVVDMTNPDWTVVVTHEIWEMMVDPYVNTIFKAKRFWIGEVADPVEADKFGYLRDNVLISDFVLPNWYRLKSKAPFDFTRHVKRPFQLLCEGYANVWAPLFQSWTEVDGKPCAI